MRLTSGDMRVVRGGTPVGGAVTYGAFPRRRPRPGSAAFVSGALEQAAQILGSISASVLVIGLVGPYIAALGGTSQATPGMFRVLAASAIGLSVPTAGVAMLLRGLARRAAALSEDAS